jgi:hypothetical protein
LDSIVQQWNLLLHNSGFRQWELILAESQTDRHGQPIRRSSLTLEREEENKRIGNCPYTWAPHRQDALKVAVKLHIFLISTLDGEVYLIERTRDTNYLNGILSGPRGVVTKIKNPPPPPAGNLTLVFQHVASHFTDPAVINFVIIIIVPPYQAAVCML